MNFLPSYIASNPQGRQAIKDALNAAGREGAVYEHFLNSPAYKQLLKFATEKAEKAKEKIYRTIEQLGKGELIAADAEKRVYQFACEMKAQEDLLASITATIELGKNSCKELSEISEYDKNEIPDISVT